MELVPWSWYHDVQSVIRWDRRFVNGKTWTTRNKKLLGAPGLTTRSKDAANAAPGITTSSILTTRNLGTCFLPCQAVLHAVFPGPCGLWRHQLLEASHYFANGRWPAYPPEST